MIDTSNLKNLLLDPTAVQNMGLDLLTSNTDNLVIPDPSNPFAYLLEFNSLVTTAAIEGINENFRSAYPILANNKENLFNHLIEEEVLDTFATPSTGYFTFFINKLQIEKYGYKSSTFSEIIIPSKSKIVVSDFTFTILNDVSIKLYNDNKVFILEKNNESYISSNEDTVIYGGVVKDENNVEWVIFDLLVKQIKIDYGSDDIVSDNVFNIDMELKDEFVFAEAYSISTNSGDRIKLNTTFSNFVYDSSTPTLKIKPLENSVNYNLPSVYTVNDLLSGEIEIEQFSSKGLLSLNMDDFDINDFSLSLNLRDTIDDRVSGLHNISMFVRGKGTTFGGRKSIDFETLRNKVINHTTGDNRIPITDLEVREEISKLDFSLLSGNDNIISRDFTVTKNIILEDDEVNLYPEIFSNVVEIGYGNIDNLYITRIGNSLVINPFLPLRLNKDTEDISILTSSEIEAYKNDYLKYDKTFYTIFKYILDFDDTAYVRVYDVESPTISKINNVLNNNSLDSGISILSREIVRVDNSYKLTFTFTGNSLFNNLEINDLVTQIKIKLLNTNKSIYYKGKVLKNLDGTYETNIYVESNGYIDKDDKINLRNTSLDLDNIYIDLTNQLSFLIYSKDVNASNGVDVLDSEIEDDDGVGIYYEVSEISLGKRLNYLYSKYDITYTNRKYLKYTEDVPLTYKEDIYQMDGNGIVVNYVDTDNDGKPDTAVPVILHRKGENVLDVDNNPILKHKKGDIILDDLGKPTIDTDLGLIHRVNLLHLDYIYRLELSPFYKVYLKKLYKKITDTVTVELENLNSSLLDNTKILYKPINTGRNLFLVKNGVKVKNKNFVKPNINIYVSDNIKNNLSINDVQLSFTISKVLQRGLIERKNINIIEDEIKNILGDEIIAVKILGLDSIDDLPIKKYIDSDNIILENKIIKGLNGDKNVTADLKISILEI